MNVSEIIFLEDTYATKRKRSCKPQKKLLCNLINCKKKIKEGGTLNGTTTNEIKSS